MLGLVQTVVNLAIELNTQGVEAAAMFSEAGQKVMGFLGNVGSTMNSLNDIFRVQFDYGFVKEAARGMINLVVELAREIETEGVTAAAAYAGTTTTIVTFVKNLGDAFKSVKEAGSVTVQMVINFVNGQKFVVDRLGQIAREIGPEGIALATQTASQIASIVTNSLRAMSYSAIAKVEMVAAERWNNWVSNISAMADAVRRGADLTGGAVADALRLRDNTALIRDYAQEAASNLSDALSSFASATFGDGLSLSVTHNLEGAYAGGGSAPLSSSSPVSSTYTPSSGGGTVNNYYIEVNNAGSILSDMELEDSVMRAIERARERGNR